VPTAGKILKGTIIYARVSDPDTGDPAGEHPAVVLNPQSEIDAGQDLRVAVCTTSYTPGQAGWFLMPSKPGGHEITGLDQACVVKGTWIQIVPQKDVIRLFKRCPAQIFKQLNNWLRDKEREASRREPDTDAWR
jgi:PemK-like, MazF-like toxin of type II toxin-antitoxin system